MIIIDNWAFVGTTGYLDNELHRSRSKICFLTKKLLKVELDSKWTSLCGTPRMANNQNSSHFVISSDIEQIFDDHVITYDGKTLGLGSINPNYESFKLAIDSKTPIFRNVSLTRDFNGYYNICGHVFGNNTRKVFKRIIGQDASKNVLYFSDESKAFVDWIDAKFDNHIKYELVSKQLGFREYVGLSIIPEFRL